LKSRLCKRIPVYQKLVLSAAGSIWNTAKPDSKPGLRFHYRCGDLCPMHG
jgi:hypothetical protein